MPRLEDIFAEINAVDLWQQRRADADAAAASFSPNQVREMTAAKRLYPDMRPGPLLALAYNKYPASSPLVQQVGELSSAMELREHPGGINIGDPGVNRNMRRARSEAMQEANRVRARVETDRGQTLRDSRSPGTQRLLDEDARPVSQAPVPDRATQPRAHEAYLTLLRSGALTRGVPEKPKGDRAEFNAAMNAYLRDDVPFVYIDADGLKVARFDPEDEFPGSDAEGPLPGRKITVIEEAPEQESSGGGSVGPGGINVGVQRAGVSGTAALTAGARTAFMALDAPVQEIQGQVRNVYGLAHGESPNFLESQSDLGIQIGSGFDLESGSGYFVDPESELAGERRRREAERGTIGGHNVTAGRWLANAVDLDPDTRPFQLVSGLTDLSVQLADPSSWGLNKAGEAGQAARLFAAADPEEAAGLIRGLRNVVRPQNAAHWLDNAGAETVQAVTDITSPGEIWRAMNYKIPLADAVQLADTRSVAETRAALEPMLGTSIREVSTATVGSGRAAESPLRVMPSRGRIRTADRDAVAFEIESFLHNAGAEPSYGVPILDKVARAETPIEVNAAVRDALRATDGLLVQAGIEDKAIRDGLVRLHVDTHEAVQLTERAALTNQGPSTVPTMVNGEMVEALDPVLMSELAPEFLTLPDAREIRRAVSSMPGIFKTALYKPDFSTRIGVTALDAIQNQIWKPLQLARAAWTVRVVGEEQLRMAAAGYDSMFHHPLSFIAWRTGRKGNANLAGDLLGEATQHVDSMAQTHAGWLDKAVIPTHVKTTFVKGDTARQEQFMQGWGSEVLKLNADPVARQVARSDSLDDAVEWFTRGSGNRFRGQLATAYPGKFDTPEQARGYLEGLQNRIHYMTGGDVDLMDAVRTGRLNGESLLEGTRLNAKIRPHLDAKFDDFAPDKMLGEDVARAGGSKLEQLARGWDRGVDRLFGALMTNRTNNLSRSPTFKQAYWQEAERLVGFGDEATKAKVIQGARDANLGRRTISRIEKIQAKGELTADELDFLAKGHGLDETKNLLYDLARKGRGMDALRHVFPFGEAWKEVITRWLGREGLVTRNPAVIRRFQQGIQGARGQEFGEFMGAPDGEGFFWKNEFGQEVFIYPGSGILTDKLLNVNIPLTGSVEGLSMFGTVIPGLGPAVQIPTAIILKTKPGPQWLKEAFSTIETARAPEGLPFIGGTTVREQILPYGSPSESDMGEALNLANYLPTWARTAVNWATNGDGNERQYGNAVNATAAYLASTGEYGTSKEERQRLMEDAGDKARWFMLIKAASQAVAPSSPSEDWRVVDDNGKSLRVRALAEEYQALRDKDFDSADREFLNRYGVNILAAIQADTVGIEYGIPTTREGVAWVISNPGVKDLLPHTYGFFAPKEGKFDPSLYAEQYQTGQRQVLSLEQWTRLMNRVQGDMQYEDSKKEVGEDADTDDGEDYLRDVREWIADNYDGWDDPSGLPIRPGAQGSDTLIRELYDAIGNSAVMDTDAGRGLKLYLEGRDEVLADADSRGVGLGTQEMEDGRQYLRELGAWVVGEHPGFKSVFDVVLSRELDEG